MQSNLRLAVASTGWPASGKEHFGGDRNTVT